MAGGGQLTKQVAYMGGVALKGGGTIDTLPGAAGASRMGAMGRTVKLVGGNYTLTPADSGAVLIATAADLVLSLPATVAGLEYTVALAAAGLSVGTGLSISPVAADKIMGNGFTTADNKDAILTGATDREGDMIRLIGDGIDGWYIVGHEGTWAREA